MIDCVMMYVRIDKIINSIIEAKAKVTNTSLARSLKSLSAQLENAPPQGKLTINKLCLKRFDLTLRI